MDDHGPTLDVVREVLSSVRPSPPTAVAALGAGHWSRAFSFVEDGAELVLRVGEHPDDFRRDAHAATWSTPDLPIPEVLDVGRHDAVGWWAVSRRAHGTFLEDAVVTPSLLAGLLLAIRDVEPPGRRWGEWDEHGPDGHDEWGGFLLGTLQDRPHRRTHGWRAMLASSPFGDRSFEVGRARLVELLAALDDRQVPRALVHADLVNRNVLVADGRITAVFDWGASMVADPLYELALLTLWSPWHPSTLGLLDLPDDVLSLLPGEPLVDLRLRICLLHAALDHQAFCVWAGWHDHLAALVALTWELARV